MTTRQNIHAKDIAEGDTLHLGTPSHHADFTALEVKHLPITGQVCVDIGDGRVYFTPFELVPVTRASTLEE